MPVHNSEIAEMFEEVADLLEIEGANEFRIRAYRNASRVVAGLSKSAADLVHPLSPKGFDAFRSVSNSALAFAGSGVADGEGSARTSLGLLRARVSEAFGCGLAWTFTFGLGDAVVTGSAEGSCHTINCGLGFGFGPAFTGGTEGLATGELEATALDSGSRSDWDR